MGKTFKYLAIAGAMLAATPAFADGGLEFVIDGDTIAQPFRITNTSTAGETVVGFGITLIAPYGFDTVANSAGGVFGFDAARAFEPNAASALATGYTGPATIAEGSNSLAFTFTNFNVGESFIWDIDVDGTAVATVFGSDLIGSTGYADFSNGLRGTGVFQAFGTAGSTFVISTFTPTPSVPEPASWAMMIAGVGLVGAGLRRRAKTSTRVRFA